MRRYAFIYNPRSGSGNKSGLLYESIARLRSEGFEAREYRCDGDPRGGADAAVRDGWDVIVACGGDGTVNAVTAALHATPRVPAAVLGVLPLGTLNHFAKDLGIHSVTQAERVLTSGALREVDVGIVNNRLFVNNSGIGIYPVMVREREKVRKAGIPRWPAFVFACFRTLVRMPFQRLRIEADGLSIARSTSFLFVGNNVYELGGKAIGQRSRLDEGVLGVCTARQVRAAGLLRLGMRALMGVVREDRDFTAFTAASLTVSRKRHFHVSLDGEVVRMKGPLAYSIHPRAIRVLAPD